MRMGVFREVFDGRIRNAKPVDYNIWKKSLPEQVRLIDTYMSMTKNNIILFIPGAKFKKYLPKPLIAALKSKYADVPVLIYLLDGIQRQAASMKISIEQCRNIFSGADAVYSYDLLESKKYGFIYEPAPLNKFAMSYDKALAEPKVFFCGRSKGRLSLIYELAKALDKRNIKYEFLILADAETEGQSDTGGIHYIEYLVYDKVVEHIKQATVLLSLVAKNNNMTSVSYNEAIMYNKKLLTNCLFLQDNLYYNGQYMKSFESVEDIDFEWIQSMDEVEYHYEEQYSCQTFFGHLERDYERGLLKRCMALNRLSARSEVTPCISVHFSKLGWTDFYENGEAIHEKNSIEAICITNLPDDLGLCVEVSTKKAGIQSFFQDGSMVYAGSTGKSDPVSEIKIRTDNEKYLINYRCYVTCVGWTEYCRGGWCGVHGNVEIKLEGVQIIIKKDDVKR
ncbi:MAG: hypothetical protein HFH84_08175 [Lachnospiraceae bacterium]|nr:hypothetical protein [Lachnospiraceae bacterium]